MIWVIKRDGRKEAFDKKKIINTCMRSGVSRELAEEIAEKVEKKVYNGITTDKILEMVLELLEEKTLAQAARYDLKMALFRLGPAGYEFEKFVSRLLEEYGYKTKTNVIVKGYCVSHEIDVIAEKEGKIYMIECKFHNTPGIYTGLKEVMYTYARFLDIKQGSNEYCFSQAWLFTNTKFSSEAKKFAKCRDILLTGWKFPSDESIEKLLEKKNLYPITVLRNVSRSEKQAFINAGFVFCRDLLKENPKIISEITGIKLKKIKEIIKEAEKILGEQYENK
ncbi:MAG TPA: hypothetical protein EYH56_03540 [Nanoarchaeota archaeon]|nr:hypothetical protein [Nanoarchaeota archaeon]